MQTKKDFLNSMISPLPNAVLKKYPAGNIMQFWAESPELYATSFKHFDEFHMHLYGHPGIDIKTFKGDTVVASHDGQIVTREYQNGGGKTVYVYSDRFLDEDNGSVDYCITAYGHLDEFLVHDGQYVKAGDPVGKEGNTGFVVSGNVPYWNNAPADLGTHLHFSYVEFYEDGRARFPNLMGNTCDPLLILTKGREVGGLLAFLKNAQNYLVYLQHK